MGITAQDIYKAFYRFDQKNLPLRRVGDELVKDTQDVNARKKFCSELLESFADLDIKIWERIVGMALAECTEYPDMDKLYEFIERAAEPEPAPAAPAPAKKAKQKQRTVPAVDRAAKLKKCLKLLSVENLKRLVLLSGLAAFLMKLLEIMRCIIGQTAIRNGLKKISGI